ncbi:hypothetical protein WJ96_05700 [Burkholderia ubonensis]|uniref:Post-SET domain-containing protein n=1 Tax=Burkholderia ubonensis TaxID=101571 RepID=A0AAW3MXL8_9BURK|nr:hypothetical protein WJ93_07495 [Burkholderia ubonensis]KVP96719.1 hypothetical protein WJ97_12630 [Burkholderia ubonensis]KVP98063.1 hypothetical protein WJ96_05700 [Burkholderia ubonensis]KVZ92760.1 hypothetical protein WL25_17360 [Burkholderia ubonensis]
MLRAKTLDSQLLEAYAHRITNDELMRARACVFDCASPACRLNVDFDQLPGTVCTAAYFPVFHDSLVCPMLKMSCATV